MKMKNYSIIIQFCCTEELGKNGIFIGLKERELEKVCMVVPLSPDELYEKRQAIYKH